MYLNEEKGVFDNSSSEGENVSETRDCLCDECMKVFSSISKLNRHLREQHSEKTLTAKCEYCKKEFRRKEHLKRHIRSHHLGDKVQCPLCSARFVEKCKLMKHLVEKHEVYKCRKCNSVLKTRDPQTHECEESLKFPIIPFECKFCQRKYKRRGYLIKHLEQFHGPTTDKFHEVVSELQRLETPCQSIGKSVYSEKGEMYEYEIGLEYDVEKNDGKIEKRDVFSGLIRLPKIMGYNGTKNLIFGKIEIGKRMGDLLDGSEISSHNLASKKLQIESEVTP